MASEESGSRRRRLAAMAGSVYRAGVAAASELREQYSTARAEGEDGGADAVENSLDDRPPSIPDSFPEVQIATGGDAQMMLFPMYAKTHTRRQAVTPENQRRPASAASSSSSDGSPDWGCEFRRLEDEKAVVDVYVHGWLYLPQMGPLTRRHRLLVGLARRMSGITAANNDAEQRRIAQEAEAIEARGGSEKAAAALGQYSETRRAAARFDDSGSSDDGRTQRSTPGRLTPRPSWASSTAEDAPMSAAERTTANANLMARLAPFLTTAVVQQPVTLFFYSATASQSRTVTTGDNGHFSTTAALPFVPTHVRVLVSAGAPSALGTASTQLTAPLSAVAPVAVVADRGVSVISDIDDTVKTSNIAGGARAIFRSTFVRDLAELAVDGTRAWYGGLAAHGVQFHYCSNSPWQLFPMLTAFFCRAGLPLGPLHLKQYSGMLQGIFEPVAERKRGTLARLLRDFPHRRFLLVGDSGEADLEVYTELVLAHPGRVLAIFIRDVTTPEQPGYFDAVPPPPLLPPRDGPPRDGPVMGTLIDLSDDNDSPPPPPPPRKPLPPPRPAKPAALRASTNATGHPLAQVVNSSSFDQRSVSSQQPQPQSQPQPPLPPRRVRSSDFPSASTPPPVNKKVDMWRRRLAHAEAVLAPQGVALYTWRRGEDVIEEAVGIVQAAMKE